MGSHLQGLCQQLQAVHSADKMQEILGATARILHCLNSRLDAATVHRMLAEYEKQNSLMSNKAEIVDDALDVMFEVDGEEQATSETVALVLREAGLDTMAKLGRRASGGEEAQSSDRDLVARLQALRVP
jgi:charged multivesicular body protein 2A